eukprot:1884859-Prymnesium_polylepis.1
MASGLEWRYVGKEKPEVGDELVNVFLARSLKSKSTRARQVKFELVEVAKLTKATPKLTASDFIKAGSSFSRAKVELFDVLHNRNARSRDTAVEDLQETGTVGARLYSAGQWLTVRLPGRSLASWVDVQGRVTWNCASTAVWCRCTRGITRFESSRSVIFKTAQVVDCDAAVSARLNSGCDLTPPARRAPAVCRYKHGPATFGVFERQKA